ncbi:MAG: putative membrane-bound dehydrogenase-like protein [Verrucomicrobiales bacterium]|jgi:putative membrane-bound dehydrogenase-like protein
MSRILAIALALFFCQQLLAQDSSKERPPNVVFILTDNHGAWTLGCYGNPDIKTPNIDRMADEGVRFSRAFCNNPVCSPTRATYLTGMMPSQHGVHNFLHGGRLQTGPEARNTLDELRSLPEILNDEGYACGLVGKWHLGGNLRPQEDLDDYWITMPHGGTATFFGAQIIENGEIRKEEEHLTTFWTKHALKFIEQEKENPFFLFLSYNGPYGLSRWQLEPLRGPRAADYAEAEMKSFPGGLIHPWEYNNKEYFGEITAKRRYAAELAAVDDGVGDVLGKLKELGLDDNTLVVFAADQGWAGGQHGFWGMGDHSRPLNAFEHSMQIPLIYRHPSGIKGGQTSDLMTSNYDFLPSVLGYLGLEEKMPGIPVSPGRDYSPVLRGEEIDWENEVFYEYENLRSVRTERWKLVERFEDGYDELYDLEADPDETKNLYADESSAEVRQQLLVRLEEFFGKFTVSKYDLWTGGGSQPKTILWGDEAKERQAARKYQPSPFSPGIRAPKITLPDGLVAEIVAAPPLIDHPMMATVDDRGRLFVAEASGVNMNKADLEKDLPNRIRLLEDTNNDGIYDKSTVFADQMTFPQGALWLNDALYVASPPGIWRLIDSDEDGVADIRTLLIDGFEFTGNAADVHGPFLHPNGRLYWCHGRKGHTVYQRDGKTLVSEGKGARIWSMLPDGNDIQFHAGGGMDNPVEIDFTPEGEIIGSVNLFYGRPRGDVLVHWLRGGRYPRHDQQTVLDEFIATGEPLTEMHNFGHVAVSGMTLIDQAALGEKYRGDVFTALFNTQKVARTRLRQTGGTWEHLQSEDFLEIHDPDVHITDVLEDADGTLLVIDTGGWFRIGCPTSQVAKPEIPGAIYRIRKSGIYDRSGDPTGSQIDWETADLVSLLGDDRPMVQERAITAFWNLGEDGMSQLAAALNHDDETVRRNAVWALTRIGTLDARTLVREALFDDSASVVHAACNSIMATGDKGAAESLLTANLGEDPMRYRAAATALGATQNPSAVPILLGLLAEDLDRETEHAVIYALIEIGDYEATEEALQAEQPQLRRRALWVLDQMKDSQLEPDDILHLLTEPATAETAIQVVSRHPDWAEHITEFGEQVAPNPESWHDVVRRLGGVFISNEKFQAHLKTLMDRDSAAAGAAFEAIASASGKFAPHESWKEPINKALRTALDEDLDRVLLAISRLETEDFHETVRALADDPALAPRTRFLALRAVAKDAKLSESGFELLTKLISSNAAPADRAQAVALLSQVRLSNEQLVELAGALPKASPVDLPGLLAAFSSSRDLEVGKALANALVSAPGTNSVPAMELTRALSRFPPEVVAIAEPRLAELLAVERGRIEKLEALTPRVLSEGDFERGREVFTQGLGACNACHLVGDVGRDVGPNLSTIGRIRTPRDLLESILFPGGSLARDFEAYSFEMHDGQLHFGIIRSESSQSIKIVAAGGVEIELSRSEVKSMTAAPTSLMPLGLDQALTEQQLLDLVAYLDGLE